MSINSLIVSNVSKAFKRLGSMLTPIEVTQKPNAGFDFNANAPAVSTPVTVKLKGLKSSRKVGSSRLDVYFVETKNLQDPHLYDTLVDPESNVWKIVQPCEVLGALTQITVAGG